MNTILPTIKKKTLSSTKPEKRSMMVKIKNKNITNKAKTTTPMTGKRKNDKNNHNPYVQKYKQ